MFTCAKILNMKRRDFIKTCAIGLCGACEFCKSETFGSNISENIIDSMEIHIVEHCNLQCDHCWHFSNIAEPSFYDVEKYDKDIEALSNAISGGELKQFKLLGGEPLLHPEINELVKITRKHLKNTSLSVVTNCILLTSMDESFWKTLADNNVNISPTVYPILIDWDGIANKAEKYNISLVTLEGKKIKNFRKKKKLKYFSKLTLDLNGEQKTNRPDCKFKNGCMNYIDGKLYRCFIPSNIYHFNKKFGTDLQVSQGDYINLYEINNIKELKKRIDAWSHDYPFCRYCKDFSEYNIMWHKNPNHDITEWT